MSPRFAAAILCALVAKRWPRLWFVVAALTAEYFAPELISRESAMASVAWASSSIIMASASSSFGTMPRRTVAIVCTLHALLVMFAPSAAWQVAIMGIVSSCACVALVRHTRPHNLDRCVLGLLLASNASSAAMTLAIGIDKAYASHVVEASNNVSYVVVSGLVLWASRSR